MHESKQSVQHKRLTALGVKIRMRFSPSAITGVDQVSNVAKIQVVLKVPDYDPLK